MSNIPNEGVFELPEGPPARPGPGVAEASAELRAARARADRVERILERLVRKVSTEVTGEVGVRVESALEALGRRAAGSLGGLRSSVSAAENRLTAALAELTDVLQEVPASLRIALEEALRDLGSELVAVRSVPPKVGVALQAVRDAVGEIAAAQEAVAERMSTIASDVASLREEVGREGLVDEVAARTEGALERRLQALLQDFEDRLSPRARRRLFRRAG